MMEERRKLYLISKKIKLSEANRRALKQVNLRNHYGYERLPKSVKYCMGTYLTPRHENYWIYLFD
jgi:hypothetical protein